MNLKESRLVVDLDKYLALTGLILSCALTAYFILRAGNNLYALTGIFTFISCLFWLFMRKSADLSCKVMGDAFRFRLLVSVFFILLFFSILTVRLRPEIYERPMVYFIATALMAGIVALEILFSQQRYHWIILSQAMIIGISVAWSQMLIFPTSVLGIDPSYHEVFTYRILEAGTLPGSEDYASFPLFHLTVGAQMLFAEISYKHATMLTVSLAQIICNVVFIYLIGSFLFENKKIGLMAGLLLAVSHHQISMSFISVPNSYAAIFILVSLYLLFIKKQDKRHYTKMLAIIVLITLIFTHTLTAMCMAILLFVSWITVFVYSLLHSQKVSPVSLNLAVGFFFMMFAWWIYASRSFQALVRLFEWGFRIDYFVDVPVIASSYSVPFWEQIFSNMPTFIFFSLSFIGVLYMIAHKENHYLWIMAVVGVTPLFLGYSSYMTGHSIIEHRWWYFSQLLLSLPLAVTILLLSTWRQRSTTIISFIVLISIAGLTFLMILNPIANEDNHAFSKNTGIRQALTESEIQAVRSVSEMWSGIIKADSYYVFNQAWGGYTMSTFDEELDRGDYSSLGRYLSLIRTATMYEPFRFYSSVYRFDFDPGEKLSEHGISQIYNCGSVSGYLGV
ncbi:hypothetical protein [Methanofollis fontis]|nr:hypothetical protein [Methanofollis fontis]